MFEVGGYPKFICGGFLQGVSTCADRFAVSSLHKTAAAVSKLDALLSVEIFECYMNIKISNFNFVTGNCLPTAQNIYDSIFKVGFYLYAYTYELSAVI